MLNHLNIAKGYKWIYLTLSEAKIDERLVPRTQKADGMSSNKQEILTETAFMMLKSKDQIQVQPSSLEHVPTMELTQLSSLKASSHNGTNNKKIPHDGRNGVGR